MKQHLNTLFVTTQGAYVRKQGDAIVVRIEGKDKFRVPMINVGSLVCFGRVGLSPYLLGACGEKGISVSIMTETGRFLAAVNGFTKGNVLLRREQYRKADDMSFASSVGRSCIIGKLSNYRTIVRREARETKDPETERKLTIAATRLDQTVKRLANPVDLDTARGIEGDASSVYFGVFDSFVGGDSDTFRFKTRSRRPPLDPINAVLSFLYAMLANDARSACEAVGLDSQVGFLHRDRPGRPSLALDLMEELRPVIADRVALSLINRRQLKVNQFTTQATGGVMMDDSARKLVLTEYQKRKQEIVTHPFLDEKMSLGLVVHIQARLLARFLRGDMNVYPPFSWR